MERMDLSAEFRCSKPYGYSILCCVAWHVLYVLHCMFTVKYLTLLYLIFQRDFRDRDQV